MSPDLISQLRASIAGESPLIICGSGTSASATKGRAPDWVKLLKTGVRQVEALSLANQAWFPYAAASLEDRSLASMLRIADDITEFLGRDSGEFSHWLKAELGGLAVEDPELLDAIALLNCPIATTNYDTIISEYLNIPAVSWRDYDGSLEILKGKRRAVLHLHGVYTDPGSIILGTNSYDRSLQDPRRTLITTLSALLRPSVLMGCSEDGLSDPDFIEMRRVSSIWSQANERRYWLIRQDEENTSHQVKPDERLIPIVYGAEFDDLPKFIRMVAPTKPSATINQTGEIKTIFELVPKPKLFGREAELNQVVDALEMQRSVVISGGPGMGKTGLAIASVYDRRLDPIFGQRRLYVSLDGEEDSRAIVSNLASRLGIEPSGDTVTLLRQISALALDNSFVAILDNAESIFDLDFESAERTIQLLAQVSGATVVLTLRGVGPFLPDSLLLEDIRPMTPSAGRDLFLAIAGSQLSEDEHLADLLYSLDGHALSIQLMAAQARGSINLSKLAERWQTEKARMLRRRGQDEGRLSSVRASFALSMASPMVAASPLARRLIGILSELPEGAAHSNIVRLLSGKTSVSNSRANDALGTLLQMRLIEQRVDDRIRMLNPLREAAKLDQTILPIDGKRVVARYLALANKAHLTLTNEIALVDRQIGGDAGNFESVFALSLDLLGPTNRLAEAMYNFAYYVQAKGRPIGSIWETAARKFAAASEYGVAATLLHSVAKIYLIRGDIDRALQQAKISDPFARRSNDKGILAENLEIRAECALRKSDMSTAKSLFDGAVDNARAVNPRSALLANILHRRSILFDSLGDSHASVRDSNEALKIFRGQGAKLGESNALSFLAFGGHLSPPIKTLMYSLSLIAGTGASASISGIYLNIGEIYFWFGRAEQAINAFAKGREYAVSGGVIGNEARAIIRTGLVMIALGDRDVGTRMIEQGFDISIDIFGADSKIMPGWSALREGLLANTLADERKYVGKAIDLWGDIGRFDLIEDWCLSGFNLPPARFKGSAPDFESATALDLAPAS